MSSLYRLATVVCDRCGTATQVRCLARTPPISIRKKLHLKGWRAPEGRDLCPECLETARRLARPHMEV